MNGLAQEQKQELAAAGVPSKTVEELQRAANALHLPTKPTKDSWEADIIKARAIYRAGEKLTGSWPSRPKRDRVQAKAADTVKSFLRGVRDSFAHAYVEFIMDRVSNGYRRFVRAEELVYEAAQLCPGLCPTREEVDSELRLLLSEKEGVEIAQGDFLSQTLANKTAGDFLVHSMLTPLPQSLEGLEKFRRDGRLDLGTAQAEKRGALGCVYYNNLRHLNAEDNTTLLPLEMAADLVLLDPEVEVGLIRGNPMEHPKYRGRRIFSAGLNLTHLYYGKLPLMFFFTRDLGYANKLYRGLANGIYDPEGPETTLEKPWMAAIEAFAIGGGCQILLVMDYVIAEEGSYFNLPARKEGIIPGVAPLRLSRFVGERVAQEGILFDKSFPVNSPEASRIVNEVVPREKMDEAINRAVDRTVGAGLVSAGANRKALRLAHEPRALFRQYMSLYCREQANCHFSPALIANLERNWDAKNRRVE